VYVVFIGGQVEYPEEKPAQRPAIGGGCGVSSSEYGAHFLVWRTNFTFSSVPLTAFLDEC
jgi:hypothetical protein